MLHHCLIFWSKEDGMWIAHGLYTDQLGTGDSVLEALTDYLRAVDQIIAVVSEDPGGAQLMHRAPQEIFDQCEGAEMVPLETYEIAHKRALGVFPDEKGLEADLNQTKEYKVEFMGAR